MLRSRTTARRYDSLKTFYADPERWMSRERDLGLRWVDGEGATYRAAWIARTEEIYCVRYRTADGDGGTVEVIASLPASSVDRGLAGWNEICGQPESYEWLRRRVRPTESAAACSGTPQRARRSRRAGTRSRTRARTRGQTRRTHRHRSASRRGRTESIPPRRA